MESLANTRTWLHLLAVCARHAAPWCVKIVPAHVPLAHPHEHPSVIAHIARLEGLCRGLACSWLARCTSIGSPGWIAWRALDQHSSANRSHSPTSSYVQDNRRQNRTYASERSAGVIRRRHQQAATFVYAHRVAKENWLPSSSAMVWQGSVGRGVAP
jgi:hypothetical protein